MTKKERREIISEFAKQEPEMWNLMMDEILHDKETWIRSNPKKFKPKPKKAIVVISLLSHRKP